MLHSVSTAPAASIVKVACTDSHNLSPLLCRTGAHAEKASLDHAGKIADKSHLNANAALHDVTLAARAGALRSRYILVVPVVAVDLLKTDRKYAGICRKWQKTCRTVGSRLPCSRMPCSAALLQLGSPLHEGEKKLPAAPLTRRGLVSAQMAAWSTWYAPANTMHTFFVVGNPRCSLQHDA